MYIEYLFCELRLSGATNYRGCWIMWKEALPPLKHETVFIYFFVQIIQLIYLNPGVRVSVKLIPFVFYVRGEQNVSIY